MNKNKVRVLILTGYGLNCDYETAFSFTLSGAKAVKVHINDLINNSVNLKSYNIMVFGGGFSWGDDHGAGVVQAIRMKTNLGEKILEFVNSGNLVLGICNGFQTLVNMGLLPGFDCDYTKREVALTHNDCGNFRDQWVHLAVNTESKCVFTKNMDFVDFPVRHGEGKFYAESDIIDKIEANNQVVLRYAQKDGSPSSLKFPENPNGSLNDIAGICDSTGRIFGLMPHPEAYNHFANHPDWTRNKELIKRGKIEPLDNRMPPGIQLLKNGIDFISNS